MRGEYWYFSRIWLRNSELPPRARRIPAELLHAYRIRGTTSACAENTPTSSRNRLRLRNYLRVRGEYATIETQTRFPLELPPRARRIQQNGDALKQIEGTTSACAENTKGYQASRPLEGNYLRVRGEYAWSVTYPDGTSELPPRARRIHSARRCSTSGIGTTSACAENTGRSPTRTALPWNYLRVRGEYHT